MKKTTFIVLVLFLWAPMTMAGGFNNIKTVYASMSGAYVPDGFDNKSVAYVVVKGMFPNGCYNLAGGEVKHVDSFSHEVRVLARVQTNFCTMAFIPYTAEVSLGQLAVGEHKVSFISGDGTYFIKTVKVE